MEGAIGALLVLLVVAGIVALCYRHRDSLTSWLNSAEKPLSDQKLLELKGKVKESKVALNKYQKRLQLQEDIKSATKELENIDKAETGE